MQNSSRILLVCCLLAYSALSFGAPNILSRSSANTPHVLTGEPDKIRIMVHVTPKRAEQALAALAQAGGEIHHQFDELGVIAVSVPAAAIPGLERNPNFDMEPDFRRYPSVQTVPYGIDAVQARDVWANTDGSVDSGAPNGSGVLVCVIDSGLQTDHEDMAEVSTVGGYYDPDYSGSWNNDTCGHGTHVAGTITADYNAAGVVGVNPGSTSLFIVKVFNGPSCGWAYSSSLIDATNRCRDAGAHIISMSLGGSGRSRAEDKAFKALYNDDGILSIAAAGNDGNTRKSYPASYDSVISVAAVDSNNVVADFSQQNSSVELAAPGVGVLSTVPWLATNTLTAGGIEYSGGHIENAFLDSVAGELVDGGLCDGETNWTEAGTPQVVLCERGSISFYDKVMNVQSGGGMAAVIYNNEPGGFAGTLGDGNTSAIPAISLSQADGEAVVATSLDNLNTPGDVVSIFDPDGSGYEYWNGTSMATPHVSGVAALVWSSDLAKTNVEIRDALTETALDLGELDRDSAYGYGLVQAFDAWTFLGGTEGGSDNQAPIGRFTWACTDLACTFDAGGSTDSDGNIVGYEWEFGDGNTGTGVDPAHSYSVSGTYTVLLTVTDDAGDSNTHPESVTVSSAGSGGDDTVAPIIDYLGADKTKGNSFAITWNTDEPSNSTVTFDGFAPFVDATLVTSHSMSFRGSKGVLYTFTVMSTDEAGNDSLPVSDTYQN